MLQSGISRRAAIGAILATGAAACGPHTRAEDPEPMPEMPRFRLSLAQWSLHRELFGGELTTPELPGVAAAMGFGAVEYVNQFFADKARDRAYLAELNARARDAGVVNHLIMVDGEGRLGAPEEAERAGAVEDHLKWLDAAAALGCATVRVNASSEGTWEEQMARCVDGLRRLTARAAPMGLNVVVENHGGLTSNGAWLAETIRRVDHPRCGTLPDFGNFCMDWSRRDDPEAWYDRYEGTRELMPLAKAVSAKSYAFDGQGNETTIDYRRMMRIVAESGYEGWIGVEYEGDAHPEREGIRLTKALLERVLAEVTG